LTVIFLAIFLVSLVLAFILTRSVRDFATVRGWVAVPSQERHLHSAPLPRLGGVAIFISFALSMGIAVALAQSRSSLHAVLSLKMFLTIFAPASLVFLLGVYDDIRGAGPYLKFGVQGLAATMLFVGGLRIVDIPVLFGSHRLPGFVGLPITILWVVAITNAFNLIDGLDGLAAGSALFSTLVAFVVSLSYGPSLVTVTTIALAGAILGFLRYNFNPATIFLGDSGSLFIGFVLSALALEGAQKAPTIVAVAIPVVSFGLPILETSLSVIRRLISGRPVFTADREHIHHKLLQHGMTHRQVVILLYGVSAIFAMLSLYQRQIFINNLAIRRATEELKVARDYPQVRRILAAAFGTNDFDGFDLKVKLLPGEIVPPDSQDGSSARASEFSFHWTKPGVAKSRDGAPAWTLGLDLLSTANRRRGTLAVHRVYSQRELQVDVNLLTSSFPTALADALDRTLSHSPHVIALPDQDGMITAQAG
jgi:UDP-N-acetylmuramyl pentapeptide phosphotransferase/UDP-N-acetylglucosamine-1-phosphate transferase